MTAVAGQRGYKTSSHVVERQCREMEMEYGREREIEESEIFHMITNMPIRIDIASFRLANHVQTCRKIMGISFPGPLCN